MKCKYLLQCGYCKLRNSRCDKNKEKHIRPIVAPVGTVKSVTIIKNDGTMERIPLDKVIIERWEDAQVP